MRALLSGLLGFLELLLEFLEFLGQISHLARVTTTLFPGLLRGIKGLRGLAYLLAVRVKPATLDSIVSLKGPTRRLAPLSVLGRACLLGGWFSRTASLPVFLGHASRFLGGCASLGLDGPGFLAIFCGEDLLDVLEIEEH
jgi:hypothetical protein